MENLFETISGKWVKTEPGVRKGTFAIELKNDILITIHVSNNAIQIHKKDENDTYCYLGDITLHSNNSDEVLGALHSSAIKEVYTGENNVPLFNPVNDITDVNVILSINQKIINR